LKKCENTDAVNRKLIRVLRTRLFYLFCIRDLRHKTSDKKCLKFEMLECQRIEY